MVVRFFLIAKAIICVEMLRNGEKITALECGTEVPPNHDGSTLTLYTLAAELPFHTPTLFTYSFVIPKTKYLPD
jgi:hypothetical protein